MNEAFSLGNLFFSFPRRSPIDLEQISGDECGRRSLDADSIESLVNAPQFAPKQDDDGKEQRNSRPHDRCFSSLWG